MAQLIARLRGARPGDSVGFAIKVIGIGVFAGLILTYCNVLLDACLKGIR